MLLTRQIPNESSTTPQAVSILEDPAESAANFKRSLGLEPINGEQVHAFLDASQPAIYPTSAKYKILTAHPASVLLSIKGADVGTALLEVMSFPNAKSAFDDEVFRTALDLYGAHFTETSARARLLTLVMVLETLAEPNTRPTIVLELLNRFRPQLEEVEAGMDPDSDAAFALDSLKRELFFRKDDSIRSRIRAFVADALTESESEHRELARLAVRVHDRRSTLVHRGMLHNDELTTAVADAKRIVEKVLSAEFIRLTDSDN